MSDDALIEAMAKAMSESGNKDWMYAEDWFKDIYIGQAIAALAVCRPIIEATLRAENEKLRAALKPFAELAEYYDVEPDAQPAWDRDFQPTVGELRAAAAALKEAGDE